MKSAKWMMLLAVMLSGMAVAQSLGDGRVVAQVPFEFVAGNTIIPAGQCVIRAADSNSGALMIANRDAGKSMLTLSSHSVANNENKATTLRFARYGDRYFLSEIRVENSNWTYRLPVSKAEKELRAQNIPAAQLTLLASLK